MSIFYIIVITVIIGAAGLYCIKKMQHRRSLLAAEKQHARKQAIQPCLTFYLKKPTPSDSFSPAPCIANTGHGKAVHIAIHDFYSPEEKQWRFTFHKIDTLEPGEEIVVDFDFYAGKFRAANKQEQLWMFDPDHDHDFAAAIMIDYQDIDQNLHTQTIVIGEENKNQTLRKQRLWMIRNAMTPPRS
jgi:hypothetical protein